MLAETLKEKLGCNTPIFTDEILSLFPQYSRAYVFRLINTAEKEGGLVRFDTGIYYIPQMTPFGPSVITAADVARKRYVQSADNTYGIYCGLALQNAFGITTQMPNTSEIVTNRESTRCRKITIDGMSFILRKSRAAITNENAAAYQILQLFTEVDNFAVAENGRHTIDDYMEKNQITRNNLLELARFFPARTLKNMLCNEVL